MYDFKPGDLVTWRSSANGTWKVKTGEFLGYAPPGEDVRKFVPEDTPKSQVRWGYPISTVNRAVVKIPTKSGRKVEYYAPRVSHLKPVEVTK